VVYVVKVEWINVPPRLICGWAAAAGVAALAGTEVGAAVDTVTACAGGLVGAGAAGAAVGAPGAHAASNEVPVARMVAIAN